MHCGWMQTLLALVILVFTIWPTAVFSSMISEWIVIVSAALLLVHALFCHKCEGMCAKWMKSGKKRRR